MTYRGPNMEPDDDYSCIGCEDDPNKDHAECIEAAQDAYDDAAIEAADARREAGDD